MTKQCLHFKMWMKLSIYVLFIHGMTATFSVAAGIPVKEDIFKIENIKKNEYNGIFQDQITIQGTVTSSEDGTPLPGVSIFEKGTSEGTTSDVNGKYSLQVSEGATLVFSFIGFETQEIIVGNKSVIDIKMTPDVHQLKEVVVVGYGEQRRSDLTGSVASADLEAFQEAPNTNILQSLQGSLPGVQIGQVTTAGQEPSITVRGRSTLSGSRDPLIVLDGIIYRGRIGDLNPADIASVDVLKDPSSKAIYGAQAANGVILITSKGGKISKKPTIRYSASYATQSPNTEVRLLGREAILQKVRDIEYESAYLDPDFTQPNPNWDFSQSELLPALLQGIQDGTDHDWWDEATSPGHITDHLLSVSGGSESTTYYISGGYTDQKGYIKNDKYNRASVRINLKTEITDWLTIGTNTFGSFTDFSGIFPNMHGLGQTSPLVKSTDENGDYVVNHLGDNNVNPLLSSTADDVETSKNISGNFYAIVNIPQIQGLSYRINFNNNLRSFYHGNSNRYAAGLTGAAYKNNASYKDVLLDNILSYQRKFGDHDVNLTLVAGYNKVDYERTSAYGENIGNLDLSFNSLEQAVIQQINSDAWSETSLYQMGRLNYSYKNRYLLTTTLRRDGFSGFSRNNKIGLFPSVGLGWVLSEEAFFDVSAVQFLKLRASYGKNGNQTSRYSSLAKLSAGEGSRYVFGDGSSTYPGISVASLANNDLSWESTTGLNVGLDFVVLKERITGSIDYFNTTTTDLLWNQALPELTGFSQISTNLGKIDNSGLEIALGATAIKSQSLTWDVNISFSRNRNEIVELLGIDNDGDGKEDDLVASGLFIGKSIGAIYSYEVDGIWQIGDDIPEGFFPGTYRIVDQNNDGKITAQDDRIFLGRSEPAYSFGIQNTLRYKDFALRFFINSVQGGKEGYLKSNHPYGVATSTGTAQNSNWYNNWEYWSPVNPDADYPQPWIDAQINPVRYLSRSFTRLQDVSLSYNLNPSITEKIGFNSAKIFISGKNLLTFTDWKGWDPETGGGIGNNQGFPLMKAYSIGIDVSF